MATKSAKGLPGPLAGADAEHVPQQALVLLSALVCDEGGALLVDHQYGPQAPRGRVQSSDHMGPFALEGRERENSLEVPAAPAKKAKIHAKMASN